MEEEAKTLYYAGLDVAPQMVWFFYKAPYRPGEIFS
jgi:hypothetical protein